MQYEKSLTINGYLLRYDNFLEVWQVSHPEKGVCVAMIPTLDEATAYARKG